MEVVYYESHKDRQIKIPRKGHSKMIWWLSKEFTFLQSVPKISIFPSACNLANGQDRNLFGQAVWFVSRINYPQAFKGKIAQRGVHQGRYPWGVAILEFHTPVFAGMLPAHVELGSGMSCPKIYFPHIFVNASPRAFLGKPFPGCSYFGMGE